ncbi:MAG: hypothetical protein SAL07_06905 [Oscillatoria sp. PMC 1051.18]|uniref:hypothetical protein n=1 Tax=Oscillatoria salina TaxID=331517 RepID=UPI0013B5EF70|nr:hypothetical protein [Oscillatoria salina]MBZ8179525.1 hypothetical protein [Oscillatoria salina IIICB1]MEC4891477.1 hypothetical protein [Oscillatoria sp. PMC 1050.18]MEC5029626.1 hypothetical protein [Oscillatoria sp. PMC 1051.18]NET91008.1 hypothetical protein [Kamptonema sp. SIO1D9]
MSNRIKFALFTSQQVAKITLSLSIAGILSCVGQSATLAQNVDPQESGVYQSNERDSLSGSFGDGSFNPFDLIHRANLNSDRSLDEFRQESAENLNNAADEFRRLQLERMRSGQQNTTENQTNQN